MGDVARFVASGLVLFQLVTACSLFTSLDDFHDPSHDAGTGAPDGTTTNTPPATGTNDGSLSSDDASAGPDTDASIDAPAAPKFTTIFASSAPYPANLGGLGGADEKCSELAKNANLVGDYVAVLSTSTVNAKDRFSTTNPIRLVDGTLVAIDGPDLWSGTIRAKINKDESGNPVGTLVWTGTDSNGTADSAGTTFCGSWTSATATTVDIGRTDHTDYFWTSIYGAGDNYTGCDTANVHIYCIGPK